MACKRSWTWPAKYPFPEKDPPNSKFTLVATTELQDAHSASKSADTEQDISFSRFRKLCRSLGLETLYLLFQEILGRPSSEERKIVLLGDLRSAIYVSLVHIVAVAASVTLLVFNWRGYYIGSELSGPVGEDGLKFLGLQFAAKMLELLSMASLSTILFALVRSQLISDSLPFGATTAGFEFNKLSLLWSKEFVATCATRFSSSRYKILLITTIIVFTILGATIGPSAAVAAQPTLRNWAAGGTVFWLNATSQELWPSQLDGVAVLDLPCALSPNDACFTSNWNLLADEMLSLWPPSSVTAADDGTLPATIPEKALISGRRSIHTLAARFQGPFIYHPELTVATTPSSAIADAVSQIGRYWFIANTWVCSLRKASFCYYNDIFYSVNTMQPITYAKCSSSDINATVSFPRLDQGVGNYPLVTYDSTEIGSGQWFNVLTGNGSNPGLSWVELPQADFGQSSIGAAVALPGTNSPNSPGQVLACTIDARWAYATTTVSFLGGPMIASGLPTNWFLGGQFQPGSNGLPLWPQVKISPIWANSINLNIAEASGSVFEMLCNSVGRLNNISMAPSAVDAVEAVLVLMLTDRLARTSSMASILGTLKGLDEKEWMNEILPKRSVFGSGGSVFNYSYEVGDQSTKFQVQTTVNGYGYGITPATLLSTIVLLIYSLIAMIYVIHSTCFGKTTSSSWESITELVALALNSTPSPILENTGAGIETLKTFKEPVKIAVKDGNLRMVFDNRETFEKVTRNEPYG